MQADAEAEAEARQRAEARAEAAEREVGAVELKLRLQHAALVSASKAAVDAAAACSFDKCLWKWSRGCISTPGSDALCVWRPTLTQPFRCRERVSRCQGHTDQRF
eukprot:5917007-Prymnesium_polylepis.1